MDVRIDWEMMSDEDLATLARTAKSVMKTRLDRYSVYEPTGNPVRDREYYWGKQVIEELLSSL